MRRSIIYTGIIYGGASSCEKYRMKQDCAGGGKYYFTKTRARSDLHGVLAVALRRKASKNEFYVASAQIKD